MQPWRHAVLPRLPNDPRFSGGRIRCRGERAGVSLLPVLFSSSPPHLNSSSRFHSTTGSPNVISSRPAAGCCQGSARLALAQHPRLPLLGLLPRPLLWSTRCSTEVQRSLLGQVHPPVSGQGFAQWCSLDEGSRGAHEARQVRPHWTQRGEFPQQPAKQQPLTFTCRYPSPTLALFPSSTLTAMAR